MTTAAAEPQRTGPSTHLVDIFLSTVDAHPDAVGARFKRGETWRTVTWREMSAHVHRFAHGLLALGLQPGQRVALLGETSLPWILAELGVHMAGGVSVPIYPTNPPEDVRYVIEDAEAVLAIAGDPRQTTKLHQLRERIPAVRHVVVLEGEANGDWTLTEDALVDRGDGWRSDHPDVLGGRMGAIRPDDAACFIYTSGTTGPPKGVVLTHRNWVFEADAVAELGLLGPEDTQLLFLPLAHSFAQVLKTAWLKTGHELALAESIDKLVDNIGEVRPTVMASVPRIFEKVYTRIVTTGAEASGVRGRLFRWAMGRFDRFVEAQKAGEVYRGMGWNLARRLVFSKIAQRLEQRFGGRLRFFISGGAPLSPRIAWFFELSGVVILEGWGLTETSAATAVNRPNARKIGSVGPPLPGVEVRVGADGELLVHGGGVMKGYWKRDDATREVLDAEGWLHTGDVGRVDEDGFVWVTDRKKDIIVTAGGKNVSPQNLQGQLETHPLIGRVVVHGDRRKFLTALVAPDEDNLTSWARERGIPFDDLADLSRHEAVHAAIHEAVDELNSGLPSYLTIKRIAILDHDLSQEAGELTPTLKVKRRVVEERYGDLLERLYADTP